MTRLIFIAINLMLWGNVAAYAGFRSSPLSFNDSIDHANIIAVARVIGSSYTALNIENSSSKMETVEQLSSYNLQVISLLKGKCPTSLTLQVSLSDDRYFGVQEVPKGTIVLALMRVNAQGQYEPSDIDRTLIRLSDKQKLAYGNTNLSLKAKCLSIVLSSLQDPAVRQENTLLIRDIVDPQLVGALVPYVGDASLDVQDNVLYNMIVNQQVTAIPRVVQLVRKIHARGRGGGSSIIALQRLEVPEAIPYLNPLLFEVLSGERLNAIMSIGKMAYNVNTKRQPFDRSSIPYLLIALRDPETQQVVAQSAYGILHIMNPELGSGEGSGYFYTKRENETKILLDWWRDELSGKHLRELVPGDPAPVVKTLPTNLDTMSKVEAVAALNPLLFEFSTYTRRRAMRELQTRADASSIPYLLLACEDPNFEVAFSAYQTLHRLLPSTGATVSRTAFIADRDSALKPLYAWWQDELLNKHSPEGLKRWQQEQDDRSRIEERRKQSIMRSQVDKSATSSTR